MTPIPGIWEVTSLETATILQAAYDGDIQTLDKLVQQVAKNNQVRPGCVLFQIQSEVNRRTALHEMVRNKASLEYFEDRDGHIFGDHKALYLEHFDIFNQPDNLGRNAALIACRHDDPQYLASLVNLGSSVFAVDNIQMGALHHAAKYNCPLLIKALVEDCGLIPDQTARNDGTTAVHTAAFKDNLEAFKVLFSMAGKCFMTPSEAGWSPINIAFRQNSTRILSFLQNDLGMGMGRHVSRQTERQAFDKMIRALNQDSVSKAKVIDAWLEGVHGIPQEVPVVWEEP